MTSHHRRKSNVSLAVRFTGDQTSCSSEGHRVSMGDEQRGNHRYVVKRNYDLKNTIRKFYDEEGATEDKPTEPVIVTKCARRNERNASSLDYPTAYKESLVACQESQMQMYLKAHNNNPGIVPSSSRMSISLDSRQTGSNESNYIVRRELMKVEELYHFNHELGRGASGIVYHCSDLRTGGFVACKSISKSTLNCPLNVKDLQSEVSTLRSMQQHPSVISLKGVFEDEKHVHLVMEHCEGGDLFDRIKQRRYFTEPEAAKICQTLASVLQLAHQNGIMHRDLKPENILLVSKYMDTDIRVADFGSAAYFKPGQRLNQLVGSPLYIAPGVVQHNYGPEADLWSLGVILYILLCGKPPFWGATTAETLKKVQHGEVDTESGRWAYVSKGAKKLVLRLLSREEQKRISARQVLKHPWILHHCREVAERDMDDEQGNWLQKFFIQKRNKYVRFSLEEGENGNGLESNFERSPTPFYHGPFSDSEREEQGGLQAEECMALQREETLPGDKKLMEDTEGNNSHTIASKFFGGHPKTTGKHSLKDLKDLNLQWKSASDLKQLVSKGFNA